MASLSPVVILGVSRLVAIIGMLMMAVWPDSDLDREKKIALLLPIIAIAAFWLWLRAQPPDNSGCIDSSFGTDCPIEPRDLLN